MLDTGLVEDVLLALDQDTDVTNRRQANNNPQLTKTLDTQSSVHSRLVDY